jgi:hypothetical protein
VQYDGNPRDKDVFQATGEKIRIRGVGLLPDGVLYVFDTGEIPMERPPRNITELIVTSAEVWHPAPIAENGSAIDTAKQNVDDVLAFWHNALVQFAARVTRF